MNLPEPSQSALTQNGVHAGGSSTWQHFTVGDVVLLLEAEDPPEKWEMESVQAVFLSYVGD